MRHTFWLSLCGNFLRATAAVGLAPAVIGSAAKNDARRSDILSKIQRQDYKGLTKEDLPTPCLVLDHDMFEYNVQRKPASESHQDG
jgi:hypothetical protein